MPLGGIVHLAALDGRGADATAEELGEDIRQAGASALALVQGMGDADARPQRACGLSRAAGRSWSGSISDN